MNGSCTYRPFLLAGWACLGLTGCIGLHTIPGSTALQLSVDVSDPIVLHKQDHTLLYARGTHIYLAEVSSNRLAATYYPGGEGLSGIAAIPWPMFSDDGITNWVFGNPFTWEEPYTNSLPYFIEKGVGYADFALGIFFSPAHLPDGRRVQFSSWASVRNGMTRQMIYTENDGATWKGPYESRYVFPETWTNTPGLLVAERPSVVTSDGTIYQAIYGGTNHLPPFSTYLYKSTDGGFTFTYVSTIASPSDVPRSTDGPCEPAMIALSDTEFVCVMRTGARAGTAGISLNATSDLMYESRSTDAGLTWKKRFISVPGVMPRLLRVSNGILVLGTGRPGNRLYFSLDDGRSWGGEINLTPIHLVMTSGYVDMLEIAPGRLFVTYDMVNASLTRFWLNEPKRYNAMMAVTIDVSRRF
ncbi:MAG TPA: sialidase family protein [Kiritimatiellia bacterium]|nr:sialidase family protein [Kiritimatiellia bacterium]HMP34415.1 sialidase family protein [Kiritimatiellia bacterium]